MRRRSFITLLGGAAAWPLGAHAQQAPKTVGLLGATSAAQQSQWTAAFVHRLRELGWIEGRDIAIEARWAEGSNERAAELAAELVRRGFDVIVTSGTPIALAAKRATATVPIVFATASDPVGTGLVVSCGDRAATSPACPSSRPTFPASASNFCARWSPVSIG